MCVKRVMRSIFFFYFTFHIIIDTGKSHKFLGTNYIYTQKAYASL